MTESTRPVLETPRLRPFARLGTVFAWGLRRTLGSGRFILTTLLCVAGGYLIGHFLGKEDDPALKVWMFLERAFFLIAVPLIALILVGTGYGEEVQDQTLVWHLVRPVSRTTVFVGRYLSGALTAVLCVLVGTTTGILSSGIPLPTAGLVGTGAAAALGVASTGAVYYTLAALFRRGLIAGLVYTFVVEVVFNKLPGTIQRLSLGHHVRSLFHRWTDDSFSPLSRSLAEKIAEGPTSGKGLRKLTTTEIEEWTTLSSGITICVVVAIAALVLGAYRVSRRDFALKD